MTEALTTKEFSALLGQCRRRQMRVLAASLVVGLTLASAFRYADAFNFPRYADAGPTILRLAIDSLPPDFSRWRSWGGPLLETLAMGMAGTALGAGLALPLAALAARNVGRFALLGMGVRLSLDMIRAIPGLIWGVIFVAAVGFGPLPGVLALAVHSTGMLGKLFSEAMEHVDPSPGAALRAQGLSRPGVLRFAVLPQVLPRFADVVLYRFEHNLRAATTLGLVGAGGLGLEIVTAFHLFEYREASALILVLLGLVSTIGLFGAALRARFLQGD
jgi:phosphonate transport system permease protein